MEARWLPAGAAADAATHAEVDAWFGADQPAVEVVLRGDRIRWRPGFAAVVGSEARREAEVAALAQFDTLEAELSALEAQLAAWWRQGDADRDLMGEVRSADLRRRRGVNAISAAIARARMRICELEDALAAPALGTDAMQRLTHELAIGCNAPHRLVRLEERCELLAELYAVANDRLAEFAHFRVERGLEVAILVVLAVEAVVLLAGWR